MSCSFAGFGRFVIEVSSILNPEVNLNIHRFFGLKPCQTNFPGERGTVCSWDKLPGGIRDMQSILPSLQVHQFPAAGHSIHNTDWGGFSVRFLFTKNNESHLTMGNMGHFFMY